MSNRFFITLLVIMAVAIGGFAFAKQKNNPAQSGNNIQPSQHVKGAGKAGVVLIEYGDLQCSACWRYEPLIKEVFEKYKDQITFQFRNFPLTQLHPNAFAAHRAVEAAAKQGKFWEMHDILYDRAHQFDSGGRIIDIEWTASTNPVPFFESYAKQLGLNIDQFKQDMASQEVNDLINADIREAQKLSATGTPTFVLDGKKLEQSPGTLDEFSKLIDDAIKAKAGSKN